MRDSNRQDMIDLRKAERISKIKCLNATRDILKRLCLPYLNNFYKCRIHEGAFNPNWNKQKYEIIN